MTKILAFFLSKLPQWTCGAYALLGHAPGFGGPISLQLASPPPPKMEVIHNGLRRPRYASGRYGLE